MISIEFISNRNSRETRSEWTGSPRPWMSTRSPVRLNICTKSESAVSHQVRHIEQRLCRARSLSMIEMDLI